MRVPIIDHSKVPADRRTPKFRDSVKGTLAGIEVPPSAVGDFVPVIDPNDWFDSPETRAGLEKHGHGYLDLVTSDLLRGAFSGRFRLKDDDLGWLHDVEALRQDLLTRPVAPKPEPQATSPAGGDFTGVRPMPRRLPKAPWEDLYPMTPEVWAYIWNGDASSPPKRADDAAVGDIADFAPASPRHAQVAPQEPTTSAGPFTESRPHPVAPGTAALAPGRMMAFIPTAAADPAARSAVRTGLSGGGVRPGAGRDHRVRFPEAPGAAPAHNRIGDPALGLGGDAQPAFDTEGRLIGFVRDVGFPADGSVPGRSAQKRPSAGLLWHLVQSMVTDSFLPFTVGPGLTITVPRASAVSPVDQLIPNNQLNSRAPAYLRDRRIDPFTGDIIIDVPEDYVISLSDNRRGFRLSPPNQTIRNDREIRIMMPSHQHPDGYIRYYNRADQGQDPQPISPFSGRTGSKDETHYPFDFWRFVLQLHIHVFGG